MKECPFCHEMIDESETLCPFCGTVQEFSTQTPSTTENEKTLQESTPIFEPHISSSGNDKRSDQEFRVKTNTTPDSNFVRQGRSFFRYFFDRLLHPTKQLSRTRKNSRTYGYAHILLSTLLAAFIMTHATQALLTQYQILADISILPSLTTTPNYIFVYLKLVVFFLVLYLSFPAIAYGVKHIFLKREHVFHYWLTQYAGMNAISFLLLAISGLMTVIAPVAMLVVILFFFVLHLLSYIVTFVLSIAQEQNDTRIDTLYLCVIGLGIVLIISMSLLFLLF